MTTRKQAWLSELTEDMLVVAGAKVRPTPEQDRYPYDGVWHDCATEEDRRRSREHTSVVVSES